MIIAESGAVVGGYLPPDMLAEKLHEATSVGRSSAAIASY